MNRFETTQLWQSTLGLQAPPDLEETTRAKLRHALEEFRENAKFLAKEIAQDLPQFTVHDESHIDALWEMAQLIAGAEFKLTPAEAFVLGGAFLVHDLGMGLAAYPEGIPDLRKEKLWDDNVAALLKKKLDRTPNTDEMKNPGEEIEKAVTEYVLRELHARHAERLALISWKDRQNNSTEYHLISDPTLRQTYGPVIGQIAHSHWWSLDQLIQNLPKTLGAPGGFSNDWTVDPIKLACLLRVADASHLDERRAPGFLRAIRKPTGTGAHHWTFQEKLYQPRLESDRLFFTSKSPFTIDEAEAWWLCFDAIQMVDRELRSVDSLLADTNRPRLAARGVSYVEQPERLAELIGTTGWKPVDVKIKVGDVARLIRNLGGEQLYGNNVFVPLRELIQNASDAVIARRLLENHPDKWGDVYVRHGKDDQGEWIEVEDTGIGMSSNVLTGPFLDFGTSFWGSDLMHTELPGLESKGFSSTGTYGIGFFSVFMWGDHVQIITRRPEQAREDTQVLEFTKGLISRPLLRKAQPQELLIEGGTRIRVWLKDSQIFRNLLSFHSDKSWSFKQRCAWLCPALDVNLWVKTKNKDERVIGASDWITMKGNDLLKRIIGSPELLSNEIIKTTIDKLSKNLKILKNSSGQIVGRACIGYRHGVILDSTSKYKSYTSLPGIVTIGGFRSSALTGINVILIGKAHRASRDVGMPLVEKMVLKKWATEQAELVENYLSDPQKLSDCAELIRGCGGSTGDLPIAKNFSGWVNIQDIVQWQDIPDEVLLIHDAGLSLREDREGKITLHSNVFAVASGIPVILQTGNHDIWMDWPSRHNEDENWSKDWFFESKTLKGIVINAIATAWKVSLDKVLKISEQTTDSTRIEREIGTQNGLMVKMDVDIIRKPQLKKVGR